MRSLLYYHQARWDQQEPPGCWIQRREANTISSQGETSLLVSFNTIKKGLKVTKQHRQALARTAWVSTSAYPRMAFDVLGIRAFKLQHSSKAHWKKPKVKTRSHLKVKILPRKIAKHTPGFPQSMAQSSKDTIKPKIRNFKFNSDFLSFKQAFLSTNTSVFQYSVQISLALHVQKNIQHQLDLLRC